MSEFRCVWIQNVGTRANSSPLFQKPFCCKSCCSHKRTGVWWPPGNFCGCHQIFTTIFLVGGNVWNYSDLHPSCSELCLCWIVIYTQRNQEILEEGFDVCEIKCWNMCQLNSTFSDILLLWIVPLTHRAWYTPHEFSVVFTKFSPLFSLFVPQTTFIQPPVTFSTLLVQVSISYSSVTGIGPH